MNRRVEDGAKRKVLYIQYIFQTNTSHRIVNSNFQSLCSINSHHFSAIAMAFNDVVSIGHLTITWYPHVHCSNYPINYPVPMDISVLRIDGEGESSKRQKRRKKKIVEMFSSFCSIDKVFQFSFPLRRFHLNVSVYDFFFSPHSLAYGSLCTHIWNE